MVLILFLLTLVIVVAINLPSLARPIVPRSSSVLDLDLGLMRAFLCKRLHDDDDRIDLVLLTLVICWGV